MYIDWGQKIIHVELTDLTQIGATTYEHDLDVFRLGLRDLEDDEAGIAFLHTHNHVPPTVLGGVLFARAVEIVNGYTVTYEDGIYGVNVVGGNHNIADVLNRNSVSVNTALSSGLIVTSGGGGSTDWTATERNQIRGALGIVGTQAAPNGGGHLQDIRTPVLATLDAAVSSRAIPGDEMTLTQEEREDIAWQVLEEPLSEHTTTIGSLGHEMGHVHDALIVAHGTTIGGCTPTTIYTSISTTENLHRGHVLIVRTSSGRVAMSIRRNTATGVYTLVSPVAVVPSSGDSVFILAQRNAVAQGRLR